MKMTRLEWRYLQRLALDHPYYDTHKPPLSDAEARAIMEANNTLTGREFVDSVYAQLGMTRPVREKERFAWLRNIGELFTVPPIRRIAIAVLVVLLMAAFFAGTPTGRAIAESVIRYVATLLEKGDVLFNRSDNDVTMVSLDVELHLGEDERQEQESDIVHVNTFEDFTLSTGVQPMVLPFPQTELYYDYDESVDSLMLNAVYEAPKGTIITCQIWNMPELVSFTSTGFRAYDADASIYYSFENNGTISVIKAYDDFVFEITADDSYTLDELISLLMGE